MNCLVIEDEKMAAERLCKLIHGYDPKLEVVDTLPSVKKSVEFLQQNPSPDLIFMDIQLADGLSFEIFENTPVQTPVIFTTAYDEYALKAFKVNSIDYLLKPIDEKELAAAIDKYKSNQAPVQVSQQVVDNILHSLTNNYKNKFLVKVGEHIRLLTIEDVQCFYSMEKAVFLQTLKGRDYAINYTLDKLEELVDPSKFFRINRKYIVAIAAISDIINYSNSRLLIKLNENTNDDLIVSREKVLLFKSWLED